MHETRPFTEAKEGRHEIDRIDERGEVVTCTIEGDEACCIGDDPAEPVLSPLLGHPDHPYDGSNGGKSICPRKLPLGDVGLKEKK